VLNDHVVESTPEVSTPKTLSQLEDLASAATFVLGHNLLGHDFPVLRTTYPQLAVLNKPVIDTLYLSPLAFPQNPYHRLVKDYKLVRSSVSHPVVDARLAAEANLERFFGFAGFREKPSTREGASLQRAIVVSGLQRQPLLAILPTGGGKSVCYQLPALVRHRCRGMMTVVISPLQAFGLAL
jgi:hypothetical protein